MTLSYVRPAGQIFTFNLNVLLIWLRLSKTYTSKINTSINERFYLSDFIKVYVQ